jgi:hypothetical protein
MTSVAGCLKGVRFLNVNASASITIEAFSNSLALVASSTQTVGVTGFVTLSFPGTGVNVAVLNTLQYISYRTSLLSRRSKGYVYSSPRSNGYLTYVNSWYQYPPLPVNNSAAILNYQNTDYFVEPVFCNTPCPASTATTVPATTTTTASSSTTPGRVLASHLWRCFYFVLTRVLSSRKWVPFLPRQLCDGLTSR